MTLRGSVREFPLDAILRFLAASGKSGRLDLRGAQGAGSVGLEAGRVNGAELGEDDGDTALGGLFAMSDGEFEFDLGAPAPAPSLTGGVEEVIARARDERDRLVAIREVIPEDRLVFKLSDRAATSARIELSSDQWRTLLCVNGERDVAAVAEALGVKRRVALGLLAGLVRAGTADALEPPVRRSAPPPLETAPSPSPAPAAPAVPEAIPMPAPARHEPEPPAADVWSTPSSAVAPVAEPEPWSAPAAEPEPDPESWAAPAAEPAAESWTAATDIPAAGTWSEPAAPAAETWGAPPQSSPDAPPAPDDRLAALFGPPPVPAAAPPAETWSTPQAETWAVPAPQPVAEPFPRVEPAAPVLPAEPASTPAPEPEKKRGLFGFGGRKEPAPPAQAAPAPVSPATGATRAGKLASFTNALIAEYNSGHYGKGRIDGKITNLLLRVDEQAEPVDRPMPIQGDTLSVQSLDTGVLPESQALPYLSLLINQIFADAERAFGKDKAKMGYKVARHQALGNDPLLDSVDIATRLPKV